MGVRVRFVAAVFCAAALAPSASAQEQCAVGDAPDRLAEFAAAVDAALAGAPTRAETRALVRARDALAGRGASFISRTNALRIAVLALDRAPNHLLHEDRRSACGALAADVDGEVRDLQEVFAIFPGAATDRAKSRIAALAARVEVALQEGRTARAATDLHRTARAIERAREPRVETYGGALRVISVNLDGVSEVHLNRPVVIQFSARLDPGSARSDTIQVRRGPNFAAQVAGSYEVRGPMVVFRPRLPTLADLSDSGLQGNTAYRVVIPGYPSVATVRSDRGRPLAKLFTADFRTAFDPNFQFSSYEYLDAPPPRVVCTVPADVLPAAPWSGPAGAVQVPVGSPIRLVLNRVPLHPATVTPDSVELVMTEFRGVPASVRIPGRAVLDQDLSRVTLTFVPDVRIPDRSRFALRIARSVADLTGQFELADHEGRAAIFAQAALEFATNPSGPLATLADENPLEVDPRTFLVFTTRDESPEDLHRTLAFDGTDVDVDGGDGADRARTSASFDAEVPGAVAGTAIVAGGDGRLGVLDPPQSIQLDTDSPQAPGGVFQFQRIHIRRDVTVSFRGSRPAVLRSREDAVIDGTILATGANGAASETSTTNSSLPVQAGGLAGPGGGSGGGSFPGPLYGMPGESGADAFGGGGLGGGGGGETGAEQQFSFPGGGGGGGHAREGVAGGGGAFPSPAGWNYNGPGGSAGGAGGTEPTSAATDDGREFSGTGGGGGGAGGNNHYTPLGYRTSGAGGGGGGGGVLITTAGNLRISGTASAAGGVGGSTFGSTYYGGGPGGGGAGGALAFFAAGDLDVTGGRFLVDGGAGGLNLASPAIGTAGAGAGGFLRLEDADGSPSGIASASLPVLDTSLGRFDPSSRATDPPSVFTGTWFLLPAFRPTVLPFIEEDFPQALIPGSEIRWEIQMADDDPLRPGRPDLGTVHPTTGESSDPDRATGWVLLKDAAGIKDVSAALDGRGFQHFRIRISFHLPDGVRGADPKPVAEGFRVRVRHQD